MENSSNDSVVLSCVMVDQHTVLCGDEEFKSESLYKPDTWRFWVFLVVYMVLVLFAGMLTSWTL